MFLKNSNGSYEPAFFIIRIESSEDLERLVEENESTFVHEYIHLLQDLVLPYCMRENMALLETFMLQIEDAREKGEMRLPSDFSDKNVHLLRRIGHFTWGDSSFHCNVRRINKIEVQEEAVEGMDYSLYKYLLSCDVTENYHFGARDLLEYIAFKIESRHFPSGSPHPDLPYRSVDLVLAYEDLEYLSTVKRIALAEYCLMNDNPVRRLMVVIKDIKDGIYFEGTDRSDDDAFIERLLRLEWKARGRPFRTIAEKISQRYAELIYTLRRQFPEYNFPAIYDWLGESLNFAQESLAGRSLFAVLYEMNAEQFRETMSTLLERIGVPLLVNREGQLGTSLGNEFSKTQFIQLLLAYQFSEYIKSDETTCPLYSNCDRDSPDLINEDCVDAPFRRASDEELCPFGVFIKATGLSRVAWYKGDRLIPGWRSGPF